VAGRKAKKQRSAEAAATKRGSKGAPRKGRAERASAAARRSAPPAQRRGAGNEATARRRTYAREIRKWIDSGDLTVEESKKARLLVRALTSSQRAASGTARA
jgi:hypothetical protein